MEVVSQPQIMTLRLSPQRCGMQSALAGCVLLPSYLPGGYTSWQMIQGMIAATQATPGYLRQSS